MERRQGIFKSTKQIVQGTANIATESTGYLVDELKASRQINKLENTVEFGEEKREALMDLFKQLKPLLAIPEADRDELVVMEIEIIQSQISTIKAI